MANFQPVTHVLFDMDGLLLDTENLYTVATQSIASQYGKIYTWEMKAQLMGKMGMEAAVSLVETLELPITPEQYAVSSQQLLVQLFPNCDLLPDTETLYTIATEQIASCYGRVFTWDLKVKQMGLPSMELATLLVEELPLPLTPQEYIVQVSEIHRELFPTAQLLPGVERLIRHLHSKGVPIAVATSSSRENFELKTTNHKELFSLFDHVVTGSSDPEVKRGKPHPDIFLTCASRFASPPEPSHCLVFEDAPNGVTAARAAGMQVVMVPDSRMDPEMTRNATLVLKSIEDFKPELFGLPAFD